MVRLEVGLERLKLPSMFNPLSYLPGEKRTDLSAFRCAPHRLVSTSRIVAVFLLLALSAGHTLAFDDRKPEAHLKAVAIRGLDWNNRTAETALSITIDNPGPAFTIKDLNYKLKLNDKQAAEGRYEKAVQVPAHSSVTFDLPCNVDLKALPGVAWGIIAGGFDVHYELETEFTLPLFPPLSPRIKTSINGDLSLVAAVSGWTTRIKERISQK